MKKSLIVAVALAAFGFRAEAREALEAAPVELAAAEADEETDATATPADQPAPPPAPSGGASLAQQLSNPVASLISVPIHHTVECCFGPDGNAIRYSLNVQPLIPVALNSEWNLIIRTIVPIIYQESTTPSGEDAFGLGDTVQSFFLSLQAVHNGLVWAVDPVFLHPTGESALGSERWGAGPTAQILKQMPGGVTLGFLGNHIWSFAGDETRADICSTLLQPVFSKAWPNSTTLSIDTETTYDWLRDLWTVPVNVGVSRLPHGRTARPDRRHRALLSGIADRRPGMGVQAQRDPALPGLRVQPKRMRMKL